MLVDTEVNKLIWVDNNEFKDLNQKIVKEKN